MPSPTVSPLPTRRGDLEFGIQSENTNVTKLQTFLGTTLIQNGGYSVFDFSNANKTIHMELKSRRIRHDQYPTAIIGANKVDWCSDPNAEYWFAYCYTDGIFVIQYNKELFASFARSNYSRGVRGDTDITDSEVVFIPHEHLRRISA
jgi:hypothetical protein